MLNFGDVALGVQLVLSVFLVWVNFRLNNRVSSINRKLDGNLSRFYRLRELMVSFHKAGVRGIIAKRSGNYDDLSASMAEMSVCMAEMLGITVSLDTECYRLVNDLEDGMGKGIADDVNLWGPDMQKLIIELHARINFLVTKELAQS